MKTACGFLALVLLLIGGPGAFAANVSWTGAGDGSSWNDPANWSNNAVPGPNDSAVVGIGSFVLPTSGTLTAGHVTVNVAYTAPTTTGQTLSITGSWIFNGPFTLEAGMQFTVTGGGTALVGGFASLLGASIYVTGSGTKLSLPSVTSYTQPASTNVQWTADSGAELDFPNLVTITGNASSGGFDNYSFDITAQNGAALNLPALTAITEAATTPQEYSTNGVQLMATSSGLLNAGSLALFNDASTSGSSLTANNSGKLVLPQLTAPVGIQMNLNALSTPEQFASLQGTTSFVLNSGVVVMHVSNISGLTYLSATGAGTELSFPKATSDTQPASVQVQWIAGSGGELDFPNLVTITGSGTSGGFDDWSFDITANGGTINLAALTGITEPATAAQEYSTNGIQITAENSGVLTGNALTGFNDVSSSGSSLTATTSGVLAFPQLTATLGVNMNLNALSNPQVFTSIQGDTSFTLNSGVVAMSLTSVNGLSAITATGTGTMLSFPHVTSYTQLASTQVQWNVSGGGELDFPALVTITGSASSGGFDNWSFDVTANGGTIDLPALTGITEPATAVQEYSTNGIQITSENGGVLTANALASFDDVSDSGSSLAANSSGTLALARLTSPSGVNINVNAQSDPQVFTSLQGNSTFSLNSGVVAMSLTSVNGLSAIYVSGTGTIVSFPHVTSYTQLASTQVQWNVSGGGELDFPALVTITGSGSSGGFDNWSFDVTANGGTIDLPALTGITEPATAVQEYSTNGIQITSENGGVLTANALASFDDISDSGSSLAANSSGTLALAQLTTLSGININVNAQSNPQVFTSVQGNSTFTLNSGVVAMSLTSVNGLSGLTATGSGTLLSFPSVTSFTQAASTQVQWIASSGGELEFPALVTITGSASSGGFDNWSFDVTANGGTINLPALTGMTEPTTAVQGYSTNGIQITAENSGVLTANGLTAFSDASSSGSSLTANSSGMLALAQLTSASGLQVTDSSGVIIMALASVNGLNYIHASGSGTILSFPGATSYTQPASIQVQWISDTGAELDFPNIVTITGNASSGGFDNFSFDVTANGATINLPTLTGITEPSTAVQGYSTNGIQITAENNGTLTANTLTTFNDVSSSGSFLSANNSGVLALAQLTSPDGVAINVNVQSNPQVFTSIQGNTSFTLNSGVVAMALTDLSGLSSITATGTGTDLSFPDVTSYTQPAATNVEWLATSGGELDFPALTTVAATTSSGYSLSVMESGGVITDPVLTTVTGNVNSNLAAPLLVHPSLATGGVPTPVSFSQREASFAITGPATATPLKDGVPNLLKYFYDVDPTRPMTASDLSALPTVGMETATTGTNYLTLTYRQYAAETGLQVNVQTSPDLSTWTTVTPDLDQEIGVDSVTGDPMIEVGVDVSGSTRKFIRLSVTQTSN
jgi:hypothetical protein